MEFLNSFANGDKFTEAPLLQTWAASEGGEKQIEIEIIDNDHAEDNEVYIYECLYLCILACAYEMGVTFLHCPLGLVCAHWLCACSLTLWF